MNEGEMLSRLLHDIGMILEKQKQKDISTSASYNIFNVIHMESNETSVHSAFIADLLNPSGQHACGDRFLVSFMDIVCKKNDFSTEGAKVEIEKYVGHKTKTTGGRIDIIITNKDKKAIIIENKIYAGDQEDQLVRYTNFAKANFNEYVLLYLTLDGHEASDSSAKSSGEKIEYSCISYRNDILAWLEECKRNGQGRQLLVCAIEHYANLIKKLTHTDMNTEIQSEMIDMVISDPNNIKNLNNYISILDSSKSKLLESFWVKLYHAMVLKYSDISVFTKENGKYREHKILELTNISKKFKFIGYRNKYDFQFGIQVPIGNPSDGEQLMAGIIVDGVLSVRAYVIDENGELIQADKTRDRFYMLKELSDERAKKWIKDDGVFVCASYFSSDGNEWNFSQMPNKTLTQLAEMDSFVEDTIRKFEEKISAIVDSITMK